MGYECECCVLLFSCPAVFSSYTVACLHWSTIIMADPAKRCDCTVKLHWSNLRVPTG